MKRAGWLLKIVGAGCLLAVLNLTHPLQAQTIQATAEDEARIHQIIKEQEAAWNRGDATAYTAHFQRDSIATIIVGTVFDGRKSLEERVDQILTTLFKNSTLTHKVQSIRFVRPDVALVALTTEMTGFQALPPGVTASADGALQTSMSQVMVKKNNDWWVAAFHNVDVKTP